VDQFEQFGQFDVENVMVSALIDSGSPISLIRSHIVNAKDRQPFNNYIFIAGVNGSQLHIEAVAKAMVFLVDHNIGKKQMFYIVNDQTMSSECLLDRDFIKGMDFWFGEDGMMMINSKQVCNGNEFLSDLGLIEYEFSDDEELNVSEVSFMNKCKLKEMYSTCYSKALKPESPEIDYEVNIICLKDHTPFNYQPRRLSYVERNAVKNIICDLLDQKHYKRK